MTANDPLDGFDMGIATEGDVLGRIGADFIADAEVLGLTVATEHRDDPSIKAGIEWLMPTAIALFLANKYVSTLLQEAAKDHYPHIKSAILKIVRRSTGKEREVTTRVVASSAEKIQDPDPASFSVWVIGRDSRRVVFRFDHSISVEALPAAVNDLFELVTAHALSDGRQDQLSRSPVCIYGSTWAPVVMRFDTAANRWRSWTIDSHGHGTPFSEP